MALGIIVRIGVKNAKAWLIVPLWAILIVGLLMGKFMLRSGGNAASAPRLAPIEDGPAATSVVEMSRIPFVGCPSDGQSGPVLAPKGRDKVLNINARAAKQLAYYSSGGKFGALAPRGWHCLALYGSSGISLYVTPGSVESEQLLSANSVGFDGPVVQLNLVSGDTSGRFEVAKTIARVFPDHQAFVQKVVDEGIEPGISLPNGPYPSDSLVYRNTETVEYLTPANADGLGTDSRLQTSESPIFGVAMLSGEDTDLTRLAVRLQPDQPALAPIIIRQIEEDTVPQSGSDQPSPTPATRAAPVPISTGSAPLTSTPADSGEEHPGAIVAVVLFWSLMILLYWIPTIVAYRRGTVNKGGVFVVNLFLDGLL